MSKKNKVIEIEFKAIKFENESINLLAKRLLKSIDKLKKKRS